MSLEISNHLARIRGARVSKGWGAIPPKRHLSHRIEIQNPHQKRTHDDTSQIPRLALAIRLFGLSPQQSAPPPSIRATIIRMKKEPVRQSLLCAAQGL